jgi:hypothetical protein
MLNASYAKLSHCTTRYRSNVQYNGEDVMVNPNKTSFYLSEPVIAVGCDPRGGVYCSAYREAHRGS